MQYDAKAGYAPLHSRYRNPLKGCEPVDGDPRSRQLNTYTHMKPLNHGIAQAFMRATV